MKLARRWLTRFSLRTLMLTVLGCAVLLGALVRWNGRPAERCVEFYASLWEASPDKCANRIIERLRATGLAQADEATAKAEPLRATGMRADRRSITPLVFRSEFPNGTPYVVQIWIYESLSQKGVFRALGAISYREPQFRTDRKRALEVAFKTTADVQAQVELAIAEVRTGKVNLNEEQPP